VADDKVGGIEGGVVDGEFYFPVEDLQRILFKDRLFNGIAFEFFRDLIFQGTFPCLLW